MEIKYLLNGIAIGVTIAAPVGPIAVLCIKRSLSHTVSYPEQPPDHHDVYGHIFRFWCWFCE
ncbi:hypothetical protein [uncultured Desulfobacter sp.]|uniref:hypothetical protein n=1 Tax=uncultured Desulfobacter sp. TaxID=240139 RepID=UPI0029F53ACF|nr:hypothetical protein [uncultured Desulfobacter sp.]